MGTTANHNLSYPILGEDNNPPADIQALAEDVAEEMDRLHGKVANAAALPGSGAFVGQQVLLLDTFETAMWNGVEWTGYMKAYTPTWTGVTFGTTGLVNTARFVSIGRRTRVDFNLVLGAGGGVTASVRMSLPISAANPDILDIGVVRLLDSSASLRRHGSVGKATTGTVYFEVENTTPGGIDVAAGAPFAWAAGDTMSGTFDYERA